MKKVEDIDREIKHLIEYSAPYTQRERTKINDRIRELRQLKSYLETEPSEEFIKKELEDLKEKLRIREASKDLSSLPKHEYEKLMSYKSIKDRIQTLTYLLA